MPEATVYATLPFLSRPILAVLKLELLTGACGVELLALRACDLDMSRAVWLYAPERH